MQCPKCHQPLTTLGVSGLHVQTCPACGGDWLDAGELGSIVKARQVRFSEQECLAAAQAAKISHVKLETLDRHLTCPACGGTTNPVNYGDDSGLIIDKCAQCQGVWLDGGELDKIEELVEGWKDELPADLAQYGPRLREISAQTAADEQVHPSHVRFINSIINGILDLAGE